MSQEINKQTEGLLDETLQADVTYAAGEVED